MKRAVITTLYLITNIILCTAEETNENYDKLLEESKIESMSTESRINIFKSVIERVPNFPKFFAKKQAIMARIKKNEIATMNKIFELKADQLETSLIASAGNAGATYIGAHNIVKAMRAKNINQPMYGLTYLTEAISCRSTDIYLEGSYCAQYFKEHYNPLGIVKLLLENGADPNQPARIEMIEEVEENGILFKKNFITMRTPLMLAAEQRNLSVVNELLKYGADPRVTYHGYTALDVARSVNIGGRNNEVIKALESAMRR